VNIAGVDIDLAKHYLAGQSNKTKIHRILIKEDSFYQSLT